jgi:signal transduction histidine kinase
MGNRIQVFRGGGAFTMKRFFQSFFARLSAIFLILIIALGTGSIIIAFNFAGHLFDEGEQLLNSGYARSIAQEIQPFVADGFAENRIKDAIHYMMVLNPMVEIYLLDSKGNILTYFTHPEEKIVRHTIDLSPLAAFIETGGNRLIRGDDPRSMTRTKPFSAAPLIMGDDTGYIYIILGGESYDRAFAAIRDSYYMRAAFITFLLALLTTLGAGLSLFFLLTGRLRSLSAAVNAFKNGDFSRRVAMKGKDEISNLGRAFNDMASTIEAGVEKLKLSERLRKELIANISHDLRSPLTSIRGYLETVIIKDSQLSPGERKEYLEISLRNILSFQNLVNELFELVMLETKQVQPKRELFRLQELAQDTVLKLKPEAEQTGVSLVLEGGENLPPVHADIGMIERLITNLIENALHVTPAGGTVRVSIIRSHEKVKISIVDTGSGIKPEDIPLVFRRYYRGTKGNDHSSGRTGLGLAIVKQIAELHGSQLSVESTVGEGTRFFFSLPVYQPQ